ncbi:MAG: hypothetical protein MHM6MM_004267 [Cercozoa sp. M6MM]
MDAANRDEARRALERAHLLRESGDVEAARRLARRASQMDPSLTAQEKSAPVRQFLEAEQTQTETPATAAPAAAAPRQRVAIMQRIRNFVKDKLLSHAHPTQRKTVAVLYSVLLAVIVLYNLVDWLSGPSSDETVRNNGNTGSTLNDRTRHSNSPRRTRDAPVADFEEVGGLADLLFDLVSLAFVVVIFFLFSRNR